MTVLLSGGAGFIGQHVARRLVADQYRVAALDTLDPQVHADPDASLRAFPGPIFRADVSDSRAWDSLRDVETVIHLAAETGVGQSMYEASRYHQVNVDGTRLAAQFARSRDIPLIVLSSRAVYGEGRYECPRHTVTFGGPCCSLAIPALSAEDDELKPVSVYGDTKVLAEGSAQAEMRDRGQLTIVRPQNVVGPGQALHNPYTGVLAAFLAMLREQVPLTVYGDGLDTRDFIHVADVAVLLTWLVKNPPARSAPRIVNAGTGMRTSLNDLASIAAAAAPVPSPGLRHIDVHRAGDIRHACADLTRLGEIDAPLAERTSADAIGDFIRASWDKPGAPAATWDEALGELESRGLTS